MYKPASSRPPKASVRTSRRPLRVFSLARCLGLGLAATLAPGGLLQAQSTWTGATSHDWNDGTNWSNGFPANVNAIDNTATGNYPTISATPTSGTPVDIFVGQSGTGRLDQTAGQAGTGNGNWMFIGVQNGNNSAGNGTFNLADTSMTTTGTATGYGQGAGSFTAGRVHVGGGQYNGHGTGVLNINTTGTLTATGGSNGGANLGVCVGFDVGDVGTLNLDNGTVQSALEMWVGGAGTGTLNQTGGVINSEQYFVLGRTGGTGVVNLSGGTINAATVTGFTSVASGAGSTGTLNVSGTGIFNSTPGGMILGEGWTGTGTATGTLNLSGGGLVYLGTSGLQMGTTNNNGAVGNGTLNLNGGTLQAGSVYSGGGTATVNFNGGMLMATAGDGNSNQATFMSGLTAANVLAGGAKINSNGFNITVGQALLHGGTAATDGGLTKSGTGMLTLSAANTYTGATGVTGGTLLIATTGSINASGTVQVTTGALTLQGTAVLNDTGILRLASGTALNLDSAGGNSETIGTLVLNGVTERPGTYTAAQLNALNTGVTFESANGETLTVAVPEPSTWATGLLSVGMMATWLRRRRV